MGRFIGKASENANMFYQRSIILKGKNEKQNNKGNTARLTMLKKEDGNVDLEMYDSLHA